MHQARTEARAVAKAVAEQRVAAALVLERAELVKQARPVVPCAALGRASACFCRDKYAIDWRFWAAHVTAEGAGGNGPQ